MNSCGQSYEYLREMIQPLSLLGDGGSFYIINVHMKFYFYLFFKFTLSLHKCS